MKEKKLKKKISECANDVLKACHGHDWNVCIPSVFGAAIILYENAPDEVKLQMAVSIKNLADSIYKEHAHAIQ